MTRPASFLVLAAILTGIVGTAHAIPYRGIEFPQGALSFADAVISYDPSHGGGAVPTDPKYTDPSQSLGIPDYSGSTGTGSVSLGAGGQIVVRFVDNFLTGSGNADHDLHIFEIGPDVEDTFVDISMDGSTWFSIGKVFGATSSIDIDVFGFGLSSYFQYVRLTDDAGEGQTSGSTVGADIDAIGAISTTRNTSVPDSGSSLLLLGVALTALAGLRHKRK